MTDEKNVWEPLDALPFGHNITPGDVFDTLIKAIMEAREYNFHGLYPSIPQRLHGHKTIGDYPQIIDNYIADIATRFVDMDELEKLAAENKNSLFGTSLPKLSVEKILKKLGEEKINSIRRDGWERHYRADWAMQNRRIFSYLTHVSAGLEFVQVRRSRRSGCYGSKLSYTNGHGGYTIEDWSGSTADGQSRAWALSRYNDDRVILRGQTGNYHLGLSHYYRPEAFSEFVGVENARPYVTRQNEVVYLDYDPENKLLLSSWWNRTLNGTVIEQKPAMTELIDYGSPVDIDRYFGWSASMDDAMPRDGNNQYYLTGMKEIVLVAAKLPSPYFGHQKKKPTL